MPDGAELRRRIGTTALAFRGYDVANLGRSRELLEHADYGPTVRRHLERASAVCSEAIGAEVDLVEFVRAGRPTSLETFPHDIATIVAMEIAQVALLEEFFEVPVRKARLSFGYSIGELSALVVGGVFSMEQLLPVPLELAADAAELAHDATMGVLFTKGPALRVEDVERLCLAIRSEGRGLIGPSAFLSPNTALLLGQGDTLDRLERQDPRVLHRQGHAPAQAAPMASPAFPPGLAATHPQSDRRRAAPDRGPAGHPESAGDLVRHRRGELRRHQRPRDPRPLDRRPATALGRHRRDARQGGRGRPPRGARAQPGAGHVRPPEQ